jgi:hypothetical protein
MIIQPLDVHAQKNGFEFKDKELERSADRLKEEVSECRLD